MQIYLQGTDKEEKTKTLQLLLRESKGQEADGAVKRIRQTIFKLEHKQRREGARAAANRECRQQLPWGSGAVQAPRCAVSKGIR